MKKIVNILLFFLLILEFSRVYLPTVSHEIIGTLLIVLMIIHLIQNKAYFKNLAKGKYNNKRTTMLVVNILFTTTFVLSVLFGLLSSQDLFRFLNINSLSIIKLHKIFAYLCILFMGLHLGINYDAMFGKLSKKIKNSLVIFIIKSLVIMCGIYSWIKLDFWKHLIGKYGFSTYNGIIIINILEYISIVLMITIVTDYIYKRLNKKGKEK